ncbi:MAG: FAD-dependent oxidoreductase, partial [Chloroflexi bacterium]|nr:FAD-dependent oxidoreductase [Chloroflexota bacterium]
MGGERVPGPTGTNGKKGRRNRRQERGYAVRAGIVGGGVGGLGAAYELAKLGHQVTLYERAPFLGGLASTFEVGGGRLERFYHHLFLSDRTIIGLLHELGLGDRLIWKDSRVGFFYQGKAYP